MKAVSILILTLALTASFAQTVITGNVTDTKGAPVSGANVLIEGTYDGTSTDGSGNFEFNSTKTGAAQLLVTFTGFKEHRVDLSLSHVAIELSIVLTEEIRSLEAVTITAGSFTAGDQSRRTIFRAVDIATTAGATADIAGALNTLPGTQKVAEQGRLFVRGGEGHETRTFIDGLNVLEPYSTSAPNTPSRGRFLPFMFKGMSFSTGGYSAEYGQALSSALVLDSKDKAENTRTDFGILSIGGDVGHTHVWNKASIAGKIQYTNLAPYFGLVRQSIDWDRPPTSLDAHIAFRRESGSHGLLKIYGNFNRSNFSMNSQSIDHQNQTSRYDLRNDYHYVNATYKNILSKDWLVRGGASFTNVQTDVRIEGQQVIGEEKALHGKTVLEGSLSDNIEIKTGVEIIHRNYVEQREFASSDSFRELVISGFLESDVYANKHFVARGGLRFEHDAISSRTTADPRFSMAYKMPGSGQFSLAYGHFRQTPRNALLLLRPNLYPEQASHYILSYQRIKNNRTLRIESYYKRYNHLVTYTGGTDNALDNSGYGFAKGVELFWRDNESVDNVDYWITYSFLDTERKYLHFPIQTTPSFASKHNFSIVYKHFVTKIKSQPGFTYSYASGRPYNNPDDNEFNGSRTHSYQDLSVNWSYLPNPSLIIYFSCTNILGRDNVFGYEYSSGLNPQGVHNSRAIRPTAKHFVFVGIFVTLSKEKSVNQLPNL